MVRIAVRVIPNSTKSEIVGQLNGAIKIKIQEPADNSRANRALCALLAKKLGILKKYISIVSGETSRQKILSIECPFSIDQVLSKLLMNSDVEKSKG
ncbi:MAG: DUF167 domain-containing protein [Opitutales bacterium]|nr:DUF167 domain-containing protein [Opitutales bacterium]